MKLKWAVTGTGGGCEALEAIIPNAGYILMTAHDDATVPTPGEPVCVGWYDGVSGQMIEPPAWAKGEAQNPNDDVEAGLLFKNASTAKRILAAGYAEENPDMCRCGNFAAGSWNGTLMCRRCVEREWARLEPVVAKKEN